MTEAAIDVLDEPVAVEAPKKKGGRPRKTVVNAPIAFTDDQFNQLVAVLSVNRGNGGMDPAQLEQILRSAAEASAKAMQKAMRPENEHHPEISAMSYPEGDRLKPRPILPYELWWNGYPMHTFPETEHWRELELACLLKPGEYTVLRKDGSKMTVSITAQKNADMKVIRLDVAFVESREEKGLTPPKMVTLYQIVNGEESVPTKLTFMRAMNEYFTICFGAQAA